MAVPAEFDRDAAERIIRRAVELADEQHTGQDGLSERALVEAADELGVDRGVVLRAVSEERLGLLGREGAAVDRLVGPPLVVASALVPRRPEEALDRVDTWLRRIGAFRRRRHHGHHAEYTRRSDVAASVQRAVRSLTGEGDLRRVHRLRVEACAVDDERSLVALVADLSAERRWALLGGGGVAGTGSFVSSVLAVGDALGDAALSWWWLGVPASLATGAGIMAARASGLDDVEAGLAGVLDRVAAGAQPPSVLEDVRRRLLGGARSDRAPAADR